MDQRCIVLARSKSLEVHGRVSCVPSDRSVSESHHERSPPLSRKDVSSDSDDTQSVEQPDEMWRLGISHVPSYGCLSHVPSEHNVTESCHERSHRLPIKNTFIHFDDEETSDEPEAVAASRSMPERRSRSTSPTASESRARCYTYPLLSAGEVSLRQLGRTVDHRNGVDLPVQIKNTFIHFDDEDVDVSNTVTVSKSMPWGLSVSRSHAPTE